MKYKEGDLIVWDNDLPFEIIKIHSQDRKMIIADFKCMLTGTIFVSSPHHKNAMRYRVKKISKLECVMRFGI